jgi:hypothetical protein
MSEASLDVTGIKFSVSRRSATATGSNLQMARRIIVPSSVFVPSRTAALCVTRMGQMVFGSEQITPSQFLVMFKFFVHIVFHIAIHFHQFHLKHIPN